MEQTNELEVLLLDSLRQLSEEFELREKRVSEQYAACMTSFREQSDALRNQYDMVSRQLNDSTMHYEEVMTELSSLSTVLNNSVAKFKK
jgi:lantibiotic modifying enzyme